MTYSTTQAEYWNQVAEQIGDSSADQKELVGYHSPYDNHVRQIAYDLLQSFTEQVPQKNTIAELGSGVGLNIRFMSQYQPKKLLAYDCSDKLLELCKVNLSDLDAVQFIHTDGHEVPVPEDCNIDLFFTVTVLQHITNQDMFENVIASVRHTKAKYILIVEDVRTPERLATPEYAQRTPESYRECLEKDGYTSISERYISASWAARLYGVLNRLCGLYQAHEGAKAPSWAFALGKIISPLAFMLDKILPGKFGMVAQLYEYRG